MTMHSQTVFLVDDDEAVRSATSRALTVRGFHVESYVSAATFLTVYEPNRSGCLVLDLSMPGMSGLELQDELARRDIPLPIIFITGHGGVVESVRAMKAGAIDFLEKPFRQEDLLERIGVAFKVDHEMRSDLERRNEMRDKIARLTEREREIFDCIVADPSNSTSKLLGDSLGISPRTVDHHRFRVMEKLQVTSVIELVQLATDARLPRDPSKTNHS